MKIDMTNITTTVTRIERALLERKAAMAGVSLSGYLAGMIAEAVSETAADHEIRKVRGQHGSIGVTIPPSIAEHLDLVPGGHLAFTPVHQAVIIRRV
jgi:hypothetical protein